MNISLELTTSTYSTEYIATMAAAEIKNRAAPLHSHDCRLFPEAAREW